VRFLRKDADPLLWTADIVAGAALQGFVRGVDDFLDVLTAVRRIDG
jgi:hypothetical protein